MQPPTAAATAAKSCDASSLLAAVQRSLWLVMCADALSMPVHWFYDRSDIPRVFGRGGITRMEAAPAVHPSSIMRLHSTSGGGRTAAGGQGQPDVVGTVILKGKAQLWGRPGGHYHHGMPAGENTLNAWCARLMLRDVLTPRGGRYDRDVFLDRYIEFMTADEPRHPDTYAESFHRGFFANLVHGRKPRTACGAVTHDTPSVGGLVMIAPLALSELAVTRDVATAQAAARTQLALTHPDASLAAVCDEYVALLGRLLLRDANDESQTDQRILLDAAAKWIRAPAGGGGGGLFGGLRGAPAPDPANKGPHAALQAYIQATPVDGFIGRVVSPACYITDSWPAVLFMAAKYAAAPPSQALLANTNAGGENCHRGSVLGSIVGLTRAAAANGADIDALTAQLRHRDAIQQEMDAWAAAAGLA